MSRLNSKVGNFSRKDLALFGGLALVAIIIGITSVRAIRNKVDPNNSGCQGICVSLTADGMKPNELAVKRGEFVQFNSADGQRHNLSLGEGAGDTDGHKAHEVEHDHTSAYSSGDFEADEAWRVQFKEPGTYQLHDHYNPNLNILVIVYEPKIQE